MVKNIFVEVVYATPTRQFVIPLTVTDPCTALNAVQLSGLLTAHPEINLTKNPIGIFGEIINLAHLLKNNDRVEIYRPLRMNPKQLRRLKVKNSPLPLAFDVGRETSG